MGNVASRVENRIRLGSLGILDRVRVVVVVVAAARTMVGHGKVSRSLGSRPGSLQSRESSATQARVGGEQ